MANQNKTDSMRFEFKIEVWPEDIDQAASYALQMGEDGEGNLVSVSQSSDVDKVQAALQKIVLDAIREQADAAGLRRSIGLQARAL
ncbi:hypothetical protein [Glutamicibacter creatinolyticus]|uniref:hypothetical protein n=1 Tax=Glutamicibacter creatinolyticus TaxID=162496 RepID=UPI0032179322